MQTTGTHINYYIVCKRKLWLFANGLNMEHTSDLVAEGKLIHESSYPQRSENFQEIAIDGVKIDFYDRKNKVVHEIKKSKKVENAHRWQLKYYLYVLKENGIDGATGILEYPKLRKTEEVALNGEDIRYIESIKKEIAKIIQSPDCPPRVEKKICKNCSYHDFCWVSEIC